jgi:hypothetical protein
MPFSLAPPRQRGERVGERRLSRSRHSRNAESLLGSRIDLVLYDGPFKPRRVDGDVPLDPPLALAVGFPAFGPFPALPAGTPVYWVSDHDHAGVVAEFRIKKEKLAEWHERRSDRE